MPRRRSLIAIMFLIPAVCSCGSGAAKARPTMPPLTPEPRMSLPVSAGDRPAVPPQQAAALLTLTRYLHGIGAGNVRACAFLTPGYERTTFGGPGRCRAWIGQVKRRLPARDLLALRTVVVPEGTPGPGPGRLTVDYLDLEWRGEPVQQSGILAPRFVLRRNAAGTWFIAA